jgi:hypothetical protein
MRAIPAATAAALLIFSVACNGGSTGTATVSGTVSGRSFNPVYAISDNYTTDPGPPYKPSSLALIVLTDTPGLCETLPAGNPPKDAQYLVFELGVSDAAPTSADLNQDFTVWLSSGFVTPRPNRMAHVIASSTNRCHASAQGYGDGWVDGTHGTVRLTGVSGQAYSAAFAVDLRTLDTEGYPLGDAGHVSGWFNSRRCPGLHSFFTTPCVP